MPHLMNCGHSDTGWCLDCVGKQQAKIDLLIRYAENLNKLLVCYRVNRRPTDKLLDSLAEDEEQIKKEKG